MSDFNYHNMATTLPNSTSSPQSKVVFKNIAAQLSTSSLRLLQYSLILRKPMTLHGNMVSWKTYLMSVFVVDCPCSMATSSNTGNSKWDLDDIYVLRLTRKWMYQNPGNLLYLRSTAELRRSESCVWPKWVWCARRDVQMSSQRGHVLYMSKVTGLSNTHTQQLINTELKEKKNG